jgi:hypothetical protein
MPDRIRVACVQMTSRQIRVKLPSLANRQADAYRWPTRV